MTTNDIILHIFYLVDTTMPDIRRHSQAKLCPSEQVTIGILLALKGGYFRAFYCWLKRDYDKWFGDSTLPECTRLQRLLKKHQDWCDWLMADPTFLTVIDSYPNELIFPIHQGRSRESKLAKRDRQRTLECRYQVLLAAQRVLSRGGLGLGNHERQGQAFQYVGKTVR